MEQEKLKWYVVDREYVNYLRKYDDKVENIDYSEKMKPYIGILLQINEFNYYVPISSVKEKHYKIKEGIDFIKIKLDDSIIGVLNINNMIPIFNNNVEILRYKDIDQYRKFKSDREKQNYIALLSLELDLINEKAGKIKKNALKLYNEKINNPQSNVSKRCCNFKLLEEKAKLYGDGDYTIERRKILEGLEKEELQKLLREESMK